MLHSPEKLVWNFNNQNGISEVKNVYNIFHHPCCRRQGSHAAWMTVNTSGPHEGLPNLNGASYLCGCCMQGRQSLFVYNATQRQTELIKLSFSVGYLSHHGEVTYKQFTVTLRLLRPFFYLSLYVKYECVTLLYGPNKGGSAAV